MVSFQAGPALQRARTAAGLSQVELAERSGVSRSAIQQIEAGSKDPRLATVVVLFRALGLELVLVPSPMRPTVEDFVRSGGRIVGRPAGMTAPPSIVDLIGAEVEKRKG
jgi:transcriptional regulator with XRE-family HTH domain